MVIWKDIPGYAGFYEASTEGHIRNYEIKQIYSSPTGLYSRPQVVLLGSTYTVAHLILTTFVRPRIVGEICRHLNGICSDNRLSNLAWGTQAENEADKKLHFTNTRQVTVPIVKEAKQLLREGPTLAKVSEQLRVNYGTLDRWLKDYRTQHL